MGSFPNLLPLNDDRLVSSEPSSEVSVFFEATATTLTKNLPLITLWYHIRGLEL